MCEFISWKEMEDGRILFLTSDLIFNSKRGKELQRYDGTKEDWLGHGAIQYYFELNGRDGVDRECDDFSSPNNFPPEIVTAIKAGKMRINHLSNTEFPRGLVRKPIDEDYDAKLKLIDDDYRAKLKLIDDDYDAKLKLIDDDYDAKLKPLRDDYDAKLKLIYDDCRAKLKPLRDDYRAKRKQGSDAMWELFMVPENRIECWK